MQRIKLVTDSTCDLPDYLINQLGIIIVPLKVYMDEDEFVAGLELSSVEFYKRMPSLSDTPSTSPPTTMQFFEAYEEAANDADFIISIHISRLMSETIISAENARMMLPSLDIRIFDSQTTGASLALVLIIAALAINEGRNIDDICLIIKEAIEKVRVIGYASTLRYLVKGGRIGRARGLVGTLLGRVPILSIYKGETSSVATARGVENAVEWIVDFLREEGLDSDSIIALTHGNIPEVADVFRERIRKEFNCETIFLGLVGPVVGSHLGPGSLFFSYIKK